MSQSAKRVVLVSRPVGEPKASDFRIEEHAAPVPGEGQVLLRTIWGFGDTQELRNMYVRTGQPGLWLIAGGLAQCRINSKYLSLQIKAIEEELIPRVADAKPQAADA